jgi:hypothetical protein
MTQTITPKKRNNNRLDRGKNRKAGNEAKLSPEQERVLLAKQLNIRPATKATVDLLNDNPKMNQTEAWIRTHGTTSRASARATASKVLARPNVKIYKDNAVKSAKTRIVQLVKSNNESIALKASQDILDRTEGKAVQRTESTGKVVEVKLDLTGVKIGAHYIAADQITPDELSTGS